MSGPFTVLIIDDEETICEQLELVIEAMGCQVETYVDPVAALKRIDEKTFDVVITDMRMDEIDGLQVLDHTTKKSSDTRVIIITGYAVMALAREAMHKGAFDLLSKPFSPDDLQRVILNAAADLGRPLDDSVPGKSVTSR